MQLTVYKGGLLVCQNRAFRCALGRGGITDNKIEGDGATPIGEFSLRGMYFREDRLTCPPSGLPATPIRPDDGWSDDPADPNYNRYVKLPHRFRHETLWRDDSLYDIVVPLGYNDDPPAPGLGSAIFMHVASDQFAPTEGCVALAQSDLLEILKGCDCTSAIVVKPPAPSGRK